MKKKNIFASIAACVLLSLSTSCSDWLDVKMDDKVMENTLFSNYHGYMTALNGVYLGMNDLYARTLTTGPLDVMAQYYNVSENNNHSLKLYASYSYSDVGMENANYLLWSKFYELLGNLNVVIEHTEGETPLTAAQLGVIRGEALALRAFLHFDLLRLYGPIYAEDPEASSIAYQSSSKRDIQPFESASSIINKIKTDMADAEKLLAEYDPVITDGVGNTAPEDNGISSYDLSFRQLRFNYYALKGLQARVALWIGDKAAAYDIAKHQIIDKITTEDLEVFPWATATQVQATGKPDLLFSSEVFFSLYNSKRTDIQSAYFAKTLNSKISRLTFVGSDISSSKIATFYDDDGDLRKGMWDVVEPTQEEMAAAGDGSAQNTLVFKKYAEFDNDASIDGTETYRYMIPLMRLSEIYLIAAESTSDTAEAYSLINAIRSHRMCINIDETMPLDRALTYEFAREVIGEGQLFYFYKRRGAEEMISGTDVNGTYNMVKARYVMPIPQKELDKRVLVNGK